MHCLRSKLCIAEEKENGIRLRKHYECPVHLAVPTLVVQLIFLFT